MNGQYTSREVRAALKANGLTVTSWAKRHGFPVEAVYSVLSGKTQGSRGMAHEIALALRLKTTAPTEMNYLFNGGRESEAPSDRDTQPHQEAA